MVKKILLAEDDIDDRNFFLNFVADREDIEMLPAVENGEELIDRLDGVQELPDIIILDQNMPKKNGIETLHYLKTNERYADIPVAVYSTYADEYLIHNCKKEGALQVFVKPSDKSGYDQMIDQLLEKTVSEC
jgi:CheY-like chemotaxis protein